jgi:hypothetical protein
VADPSITDGTVRTVLKSWGPGRFDAQLILEGKASATLIPAAPPRAQKLGRFTL